MGFEGIEVQLSFKARFCRQFSVCNKWQRKPAAGGLALPLIAGFGRPPGGRKTPKI
jgi:hypothetical protein